MVEAGDNESQALRLHVVGGREGYELIGEAVLAWLHEQNLLWRVIGRLIAAGLDLSRPPRAKGKE